ncbi:type IX secretion system outer membrane channel protein PorV [Nonlabens antarcticus]|uniref:type IX secretion system outer membrane channel protein PorV n=1 Tax=Nonlabens antarcticus TaxID=392714 RepID=UPI001891DC1A|nr:type IX secretion system outer membrane channel protein PorV [Nonlabens antarcticus]
MKRVLLQSLTFILFLIAMVPAVAQDSRLIQTGLPFLRIAGDPRSAGMADMGVATSPDAWSQQWNPAKYSFMQREQALGIAYTPYLGQLVNDIGIGQLVYANRINEQSAFAASLRYFGLGTIFITEDGENGFEENPNEFVFDGSYSLKLSEQFSMAVTGRFLRSDLRIQSQSADASAANTFSVGISGYYQSEEVPIGDMYGRYRGGFNIANIGPKFSYDLGGRENFQPTNLGIGGGIDLNLNDGFSKIGITAEFNKLLVPTPPVRDLQDTDGDGDRREILEGQDDDVSFFSGIFQSFGDAPGGASEELKEVTWALGAEYTYDDSFALRTGYFNEADEKGGRKFLSLGAGFKFSEINVDLSYLFSTSRVQSPLEGTLRFGLTFNFGEEYLEY